MVYQKTLTAAECAEFLGLSLIGANISITSAANLNNQDEGLLKFVSVFDENLVLQLNTCPNNFFIVAENYSGLLKVPHVLSKNPRRDFCKVTSNFFPVVKPVRIEDTARIYGNVVLGNDVYIGHNVVIEEGAKIGDHSVILHNVIISKGTAIGNRCLIKSGSIIGQKGFGFEREEDGTPIPFTHYGKVVIGNDVEIGALNTIVAGALGDTIIGDQVKTDDHVHIAHNVHIESGVLIAACAEISGSVKIGKFAWIGPNSSIRDKAILGSRVFVGIGAVVTKSFASGAVIAGNPAKLLNMNNS